MKIAIKANPSRGEEIISLLESLGGIKGKLTGSGTFCIFCYYIDKNNLIRYDIPPEDYKIYTLEEFEKEFSFKIGDIVVALADHKSYKIIALENYNNKLRYKLDNGFHYSPKALITYKEMKEERNITLTLDKAKEWYKKDGELKEIALQAFTEEELTKVDLPKTWEEFYEQFEFKHVLNNCLSAVNNNFSMRYVTKFEAFVKLQYLRDCWRQGNVPQGNKYKIRKVGNKYTVVWGPEDSFLSFCDKQIAEEFLECFRDLIKKAGDLI